MNDHCSIDESLLLEYAIGDASDEIRQRVAQSPACQAVVERLAREVIPLMTTLYRSDCPDTESLVQYQERHLDGIKQLLIRRHLQECPVCQEEIRLLVDIDTATIESPHPVAVWLDEAVFGLRQRINAKLRSAQELQILGPDLHFETPHFSIACTPSKLTDQQRVWSLFGAVRTSEGLRAAGLIKDVFLTAPDDLNLAIYRGEVKEDGTFIFKRIEAGVYSLRLAAGDEEIIAPPIHIDDES